MAARVDTNAHHESRRDKLHAVLHSEHPILFFKFNVFESGQNGPFLVDELNQ